MQTLTYTQKPEDGDKGSVFWDVLANLFTLYDDHVHDGATSDQIQAKHVLKSTNTGVNPTTLDTNNMYYTTVTMPSGTAFDDISMEFRITACPSDSGQVGAIIHPSVLKLTANTFKVWVTQNDITMTILYR